MPTNYIGKSSIQKGIGFGLTSGIITTIGLMVGLYASTRSEMTVVGGILIIAMADSLSDALGVHMAEESDKRNSTLHIWEATIATFVAKFLFSLSFIVPFLLVDTQIAIIIGVLWGLILITVFSCHIACRNKESKLPVVTEHIVLATVVVIATHYLGAWLGS